MISYRTVVADPPWDYSGDKRISWAKRHTGPRVQIEHPYPFMTASEISALPVSRLAAEDAHLYLWTTQRYLEAAFTVARAWKFTPIKTLVWAKKPRGFHLGGTFGSATEFCLYCRRGKLPSLLHVPRDWFDWPRPANRHSAKPEAFLDLVETVSPGPYIELFARRNRLGWDTWGDEAHQHVELIA